MVLITFRLLKFLFHFFKKSLVCLINAPFMKVYLVITYFCCICVFPSIGVNVYMMCVRCVCVCVCVQTGVCQENKEVSGTSLPAPAGD